MKITVVLFVVVVLFVAVWDESSSCGSSSSSSSSSSSRRRSSVSRRRSSVSRRRSAGSGSSYRDICGLFLFTCRNGQCISSSWKCDGHNDCGDNSDESNCALVGPACGPFQIPCSNGYCIPSSWKCDGFDDCADNSDESNCGPYGQCSEVNMVLRDEWGARSPKSTRAMSTPVGEVFIHHTTGSACYSKSSCSRLIRIHQNYHMNTKDWADIGYNFLVGEDGRVYEGRGFDRQGSHTYGYNSRSIAVSFVGDYTSRLPNRDALDAAKAIIECGVRMGKVTPGYRLRGHRDVRATPCPGGTLYSHIRTWPHYR